MKIKPFLLQKDCWWEFTIANWGLEGVNDLTKLKMAL